MSWTPLLAALPGFGLITVPMSTTIRACGVRRVYAAYVCMDPTGFTPSIAASAAACAPSFLA